MPAVRNPKRPKLTPIPRYELDASLCPIIDTTLKAARQCSQQAAPLESCLQDELRILERIYYKGVNQHRMALFWKRVQEVRRLGRRVVEVQLLRLLDDLRYSFYVGEDSERKTLRGAWVQVPDAKFLNFIYDRLIGLMELLTTAKERLSKAFHTLSQTMQTGAFLQLILMLTAIVSRMNAITEALDTIFRTFLNIFETLLDALGHKSIKPRVPELPKPSEISQKTIRRVEDHEAISDETHGEDLGSAVPRRTTSEGPSNALPSTEPNAATPQDQQALPVNREEEAPVLPELPSVVITTSQKSAEGGTDIQVRDSRSVSDQARPDSKLKENTAKVKKKKKKRKDEIDEIFGSL